MHKRVLNGLSLAYKLKRITLLLLVIVPHFSEVLSRKYCPCL
jgi:hypothetical protein